MKRFFVTILIAIITTFPYASLGEPFKGGIFTRLEKYKPPLVAMEDWISGDLKELISSAKQGDAEAQYLLAKSYQLRGEDDKSIDWYLAAAEQGHKGAEQYLKILDNVPSQEEIQNSFDTIFETISGNPELILPSTKKAYSGRKYTTDQLLTEAYAGDAWAQNVLGVRYESGDRVIENYVEAYAWFLVSSMNGSDKAKNNKKCLKLILSPSQIADGQNQATKLCSEIERKKVISEANPNDLLAYEISPSGYGSGLLINGGFVLTCWHVVDGAKKISIVVNGKEHIAYLVQKDEANDIAVLKTPSIISASALSCADEVKLGEKVFTLGFPNPDLQGTDVKFTTGTISSLTGFENNPRYYQISAPLQSGNSGGPLFNEKGNLIGIVAAKLDSIVTLSMTGDLPQNVNYAIKAGYAVPLLKTVDGFEMGNGRNYEIKLLDLIEDLKKSVVMIKVY